MALPNKTRVGIAGLALSAAAYVGVLMHEGYTSDAIIPVKGDVPTVGFGSTYKEDGTRVKMGDKITPQKAAARTLAHIQKDETIIKQCVKAPLTQGEYDTMVDFAYQYGTEALCASSMVRNVNAGNYRQACESYLLYKMVAGRDCSVRMNNCGGVWMRSQERYQKCMESQP